MDIEVPRMFNSFKFLNLENDGRHWSVIEEFSATHKT
jgi:hypothetical protein